MAHTTERGLHREVLSAATPQGQQINLYQASYALLVGVSRYTDGWSNLEAVPKELDAVESALERHGFAVERVLNPKSQQLSKAMRHFIDRYGYDEQNRLLIYFSGHGHSLAEKGYILPADTPLPDDQKAFRRAAISMNQVMSWARDVSAKHVLFLFDSCFSGNAFKLKNLPAAEERYIRKITGNPVRQFITAGSDNDIVPAKSQFSPLLVDALQGEADLNEDGYITGSELGLHISQELPKYIDQTPQYGKIQDYHLALGDFVFFVPQKKKIQPTKPLPAKQKPTLNQKLKTSSALNSAAGTAADPAASSKAKALAEIRYWEFVEKQGKARYYKQYLDKFPGGVFVDLAHIWLRESQQTARISKPANEQSAKQADVQSAASKSEIPAESERDSIMGKLTIKVEPEDARVRIMNIPQRYRDGIELKKGRRYDVYITHDGYVQHREWLTLREDHQVLGVILQRESAGDVLGEQITAQQNAASRALEPEMVPLPGGCYQMGSPASEPGRGIDENQHEVCIKPVLASKYEITFDEFDRYTAAIRQPRVEDEGWGRGRRPVVNVSWKEATAYAKWLSEQTGKRYRLPTEAEWEYAARAGSSSVYSWGEKVGTKQANCDGCGSQWDKRQTAPVGSFPANQFALHDMHGNVWEWTCSYYGGGYQGGETHCQKAAGLSAAIRGGSWHYPPVMIRAANRSNYNTENRLNDIGFRLFQDPD